MAPLTAKKRKKTFRQAPWLTLPNLTGGTTALKLRVHLSPSKYPRATPVREILSPSLGARIEIFGRAAATNCVGPRGDGVFPAGRFSFYLKRLGASPRGLAHFVLETPQRYNFTRV
jgi:hypothetical protein